MMSAERIVELTQQGESTTLEFKSCTDHVSTSVYESICAFLNREGGQLIMGVDDTGNIQGVNEHCVDSMVKNFINTLNNPQLFIPIAYLSPEVIKVNGKTVIHVNIPESSQVHRYKGKVYDRMGDADNDITQSFYLVDNLYLKKRRVSSENDVLPCLTMDDFDGDTFKKMRSHVSIHKPDHPWLEMNDEEILRSCFWRKDPLTNQEGFIMAAILLFGKENSLLACCPFHRTDAIYRNMSYERYLHPLPTDPDIRYHDRDMICTNLIQSYSRLMKFVDRNLPDVFRLDEQSINRLDVRNLIFREVVANMLVHREYAHSYPSKFLVFSDRVITENWTKPMQYGNITIENWESHTKNPLITKVFREMKWVEELGSGKKNIRKYAPLYYEDYQIEIQNNEKFVFSITYRDIFEEQALSRDQVGTKSGLSRDQVGTKSGLSREQVQKILSFCKADRSITEIMEFMELSNRTKFRGKYVNPLLEEGVLAMSIPDKPNSPLQRYYTTEKGISLCLEEKSSK